MKLLFFLSMLFVASITHAKNIGNQYDYICQNEDGKFEVSIFKSENKKVIKINGEFVNADTISIQPKLGSKEIKLYFLGAPGEDEQNNICQLIYTNAR
jgi:hypothetical protein